MARQYLVAHAPSELVDYVEQLGHFAKYLVENSTSSLERGMMIISIDIDVGNKELGVVNQGRNDRNVNNRLSEFSVGAVEELALPLFLDLFRKFDHPVTFAIRGQWLDYPNVVLQRLLSSSVQHDIGAHGYFHSSFNKLSSEEARNELDRVSAAMKRHDRSPTSFVFPRNSVAHLDLLPIYGFRSYRESNSIFRAGLYIANYGQLWDIHPSLYINNKTPYILTKKILDKCVSRKLPFHIWFHLWNFGKTKDAILKKIIGYYQPLLRYARLKAVEGVLNIETMNSAVEAIKVRK
jgi:peptidoglycan/xylan/chitin deacetylase (PgdA/CDA1 family)